MEKTSEILSNSIIENSNNEDIALEGLRSVFRDTTTKEIFEQQWGKVIARSPDSEGIIANAYIFFKNHVGADSMPYKWEIIREKTHMLAHEEGARYLDAFIQMGKNAYYAGMSCYSKTVVSTFSGYYDGMVPDAIERKQFLDLELKHEILEQRKIVNENHTTETIFRQVIWTSSLTDLGILINDLIQFGLIREKTTNDEIASDFLFEKKSGHGNNKKKIVVQLKPSQVDNARKRKHSGAHKPSKEMTDFRKSFSSKIVPK